MIWRLISILIISIILFSCGGGNYSGNFDRCASPNSKNLPSCQNRVVLNSNQGKFQSTGNYYGLGGTKKKNTTSLSVSKKLLEKRSNQNLQSYCDLFPKSSTCSRSYQSSNNQVASTNWGSTTTKKKKNTSSLSSNYSSSSSNKKKTTSSSKVKLISGASQIIEAKEYEVNNCKIIGKTTQEHSGWTTYNADWKNAIIKIKNYIKTKRKGTHFVVINEELVGLIKTKLILDANIYDCNQRVASNTKVSSNPWGIGESTGSYYSHYDKCSNVTNSFVEMIECGSFYRKRNCIDNTQCGNEGNLFVQYANTLASEVKVGALRENEAMLKFIEFRANLTKKGSGSGASGISNFNNFLEFQRTVKSVSDGNIGVLSPW